mgnify:CR=1 FL=1
MIFNKNVIETHNNWVKQQPITLTDLKVVNMQSENLSLTLEKELVVSQGFDKLEGKDQKDNQDQDNRSKVKKARKTTKVKVATRLCIFE